LPHRSPNDWKTADLALPINHFFIRKDGAEIGTPVHWNFRDVRQSNAIRIVAAISRNWLGLFRLGVEPGIVNLEKNPLRPAIEFRIGCADFARPIVRETDAL